MAYTVKDFVNDYDISVQDSPFYNQNAYEVMISDEITGRRIYGAVWAESENRLRQDLDEIMSESQFIARIDEISDPYNY